MPKPLSLIAAQIYGAIQGVRAGLYAKGLLKSHTLPCKVVCVGNLTAGGTGKTPMIMYLARLLQKAGYQPVILSRGYRGALENTGGMVSDTERVLLGSEDAGDEPYLLACRLPGVPVLVGKNRYQNGLKAINNFKPDVILLDDGFQHLQLNRDLNLLLMDASRPLDNGHVIPAGMLREKPRALNRAGAVVFTRSANGQNGFNQIASFIAEDKSLPYFTTNHKSYSYFVPAGADLTRSFANPGEMHDTISAAASGHHKVFVFSGIAKNQSFLDSLAAQGLTVTGRQAFADHYAYTDKDLADLCCKAADSGATLLATTEKDHAKLQGKAPMDMVVNGVGMDFFGREEEFARYFLQALGLASA